MRVSRRTSIVAALLVVTVLAGLAALVGSSSSQASPQAAKATFLASLISDIGKFNDRSFNQSQLEGLKRAKKQLKVNILPLQSNSTSDYVPNFNQAVRSHANITIAAGFLLADTLETFADQFPGSKFAITDYCAKGAAAKCITGSVLKKNHPNVMGLDYAANQSGCLVGYLAAEMAVRAHKNTIGAVGGLHIPPVDIWIAGYKHCAKLYKKNINVLVGYSGDFVKSDLCKTVAENQIAQGSYVEFQVAGGCGLGTLKAAAAHKIWGIGVDKDQYKDSARVLTSGVKKVDLGIFNVIKATKTTGKFNGNHDLQFTLKNGGMGVGKINPTVPKKFITAMNRIKARIIAGTLKVPTKLT